MARKYHIVTLGCQMNKNDSERIVSLLDSLGLKMVNNPQKSDLLIIVSCSVRQSAEDRVIGMVHNWQELRKTSPDLIIAVTGCMPGRDTDGKLKRKFSGVDLWFGIEELPRLPFWLSELGLATRSNLQSPDYLAIEAVPEKRFKAFLTIQTGCNNFCTYCVVPNARGRERNRKVSDIMSEASRLAKNGCLELTLLGQVVNHYIAPDPENFCEHNPFRKNDDFAALLWELNQINGIKRIYFTAPDPQYFNTAQIKALNLPKQANYLHLPVQSGDNEILKKMNRHYTREEYIKLVKRIHKARPGIAIGTDIIVGFCGETKKQFLNTLELYKKCGFDIAYIAMYSERSGTAAARAFKDNVPRVEKKRRWDELQALMESRTLKKNKKYIGEILEVLVNECDGRICSGNSSEMKLVSFVGRPNLIGKIVRVKIFEALEWVVKGELIK